MAAIKIYVHHADTPAVDDLCPKCWNPGLRTYTYQQIDLDGITILGTRVACTSCRVWVAPLKELTQ